MDEEKLRALVRTAERLKGRMQPDEYQDAYYELVVELRRVIGEDD